MAILREVVKSRKFWAAAIGLVMVFVKAYAPNFPVTEDQVMGIVGVLVAYIIGTGLENVGAGGGGPKIQ
jgi:hypothetical protein